MSDGGDFYRPTYYIESWIERKQQKKSLRRFPSLARRSLQLVWSVGRGQFLLAASLQLIGGAGAFVQIIAGRDVLAGVLSADRVGSSLAGVAPQLLLLIGATAFMRLASAFQSERQGWLQELVIRRTQEQVLDVACAVDLEMFESSSFYDRLQRAMLDGRARPWGLVQAMIGITSGVAGSVGLALALLAIAPSLVVFVLVAYLPLWWARKRVSRESYEFMLEFVENRRQRDYVRDVLTGRDEAKEVRAFGLASLLRRRYARLYDEYFHGYRRRLRSRLRLSLLGGLATSVLFGATIAFLYYLWRSGRVGLAGAGAALAGVQMLGTRIESLVGGVSSLYENSLFLDDFHDFLDLKPPVADGPHEPAPPSFSRLLVDDVTFVYPGSNVAALAGVTLEIGRGEIVALVGENGSGKTTLAKLLGGLFRPNSGRILWDGRDAAEFDPDELRRSIAVIFQDFVRYKLPARENIAAGLPEKFDDAAAIAAAAQLAGADEFLRALPDGYDTILSKEFRGGKDLSIGQWQRVALARAFFRDAPFIILDEPTASLDARAEHALFESIREMSRGRTILLISHRFSTVRSADRIYVLDKGKVIESGNHEELMRLEGIYSELFTLQASSYLDAP